MTWFMDQEGEVPPLKPRGKGLPISTFGQSVGAAFTQMNIERDVWGAVTRARNDAESEVLGEAMPRLGEQKVRDALKQSGYLPDIFEGNVLDAVRHNKEAKAEILGMARDAQAADPSAWNGIDLSDDRIERMTNEPLQKAYQDAQDILDMSPNAGLAGFVGESAAMVLDPKALPLLFVGGGSGSIMKIMAREAAINMGIEAMYLPKQFEMADRLNIPDPDVRAQLAMAAAGGAVFGGAVEAGARGLAYFRNRSAPKPIPGLSTTQSQAAVDAAEGALVAGRDPFPDTVDAIEALRPPPPPREPLILMPEQRVPEAQSPLVPNQIEERRLDPLPGQTPEPIPNDDLVSGLSAALDEAKAADRKGSKPLARFLRASKGPNSLKVHPEGTAAAELKARDITAKSVPGLFSKQGRKDFDNLVATEMEAEFPGIIEATKTQRGADYLDSQGFLDVLIRDIEGDSTWLRTRKDVLDLERQLDEAQNSTASEDFVQGRVSEPDQGGWFVDLNAYQFDNPDWEHALALDFEDYLSRQWEGTFFTPEEKAEMLAELRTRGGDAGYLVERMSEREFDEASAITQERPDNGLPFGEDVPAPESPMGPRASDSGRSEVAAVAGPEGATRAGDAEGAIPEQFPGTERVQTGVDQRNRAEISARQQQSMIRRLDQTRVEDDAGGLFGGAQRELFDDPTSPKSQEFLDSILRDLEDEVATDDSIPLAFEGDDGAIGLMTDDGRPIATVQDLLDEIRDYDMAAQEIAACRTGGANDPV